MAKETLQQKIKRALGRFTPGRIAIIMLGTAILSFGIHNIHQRTHFPVFRQMKMM